jgi:hypothetical protein
MSPEFALHTSTLHEVGGKKTMFVGDVTQWSGEKWEGDEVHITQHHNYVKLFFEDEDEQPVAKGFFGKLFGSAY